MMILSVKVLSSFLTHSFLLFLWTFIHCYTYKLQVWRKSKFRAVSSYFLSRSFDTTHTVLFCCTKLLLHILFLLRADQLFPSFSSFPCLQVIWKRTTRVEVVEFLVPQSNFYYFLVYSVLKVLKLLHPIFSKNIMLTFLLQSSYFALNCIFQPWFTTLMTHYFEWEKMLR